MLQLFVASTALAFALVASIPASQVFTKINQVVATQPRVAGVSIAATAPSPVIDTKVNPTPCVGNCGPTVVTPIVVSTDAVVTLTQTSVVLQGKANPNGHTTSGWFRYATVRPASCTDNFGIKTTPVTLGSGNTLIPLQSEINGLSAGATYFYCAFAGDSINVVGGSMQTFSILAAPSKPDLTITSLALVATNNTSARYLRATVINIGTAPVTQNVSLSMYNHAGIIYPVTLLYTPTSSFAPGASVDVVGPRAQVGNYTYSAVVDPANAIPELNEDNNSLSQSLNLASAEVRITSLKVQGLTSRSATISWKTSKPTTGVVKLTPEPPPIQNSMMVSEGNNQALITEHTVSLQNLAGGQRYIYQLLGTGEDISYASQPYNFVTYRPGEDLPDLVPQIFSFPSTSKTYAGYQFNGENVNVYVRNNSNFDAGAFGVWLAVREVQTNAVQCAPAITIDSLPARHSKLVNFTLNDFIRCAPLQEGRYYLELAIDKSPVSDINQVIESNELNNVRTLPPFTVLPASLAPHFTNFLLRPDPALSGRTRLEFSLVTNLNQSTYRPDAVFFTEPTDGIFDSQTSHYTHNAAVVRDTSGRYHIKFTNTPGVSYHVRVWSQHTNVFSDDMVVTSP